MGRNNALRLTRRDLCRLIGMTGVSLACPGGPRAQTAIQSGITLILDVTGPLFSPALVPDLLEPLLGRDIPFGWIHRGTTNDPPATRAAMDLAGPSATLLEILPFSDRIVDARPFFRMYGAHMARRDVDRIIDEVPEIPTPWPVSIVTGDPGGMTSFEGVRTAGFRNVFLLSGETTPPDATGQGGHLSIVSGGLVADVANMGTRPVDELAGRVASAPLLPVYLGLRNPMAVSRNTLRANMEALAEQVAGWRHDGSAFALRPRDYAVWTGAPSSQQLVLRVEAPRAAEPAERASFETFTAALRQAGIGFSIVWPAGEAPGPGGGDCVLLAEPAGTGEADAPGDGRGCFELLTSEGRRLRDLAGQGWGTGFLPRGGVSQGMDWNGLLGLPTSARLGPDATADRAELLVGFGTEAFVAVAPPAYRTEALQSRLVTTLLSASRSVGVPWRGVGDYLATTRPPDPIFDIMQTTRSPAPDLIAPAARPLEEAERTRLLEDAGRAWSYFTETTLPSTGLCPSTIRFDRSNPSSYPNLTMWDIGSLLHAVLAARDIGLIEEADFLVRTEAILNQLPNRQIGGLRLPSAAIPTDGAGAHTIAFDACDTGRLLSALRDVALVPGLRALVAQIVGGWQLGEIVIDGHIQSIDGTRMRDSWWSHCTPYAARAYEHWGLDIASPYPPMTDGTPTLSRMRLLYEVAAIGALGAEPLLLEPLELGPSASGSYVIDVLWRAQADAFLRTGELYCVSESPIDRSPWFFYQGLNLNRSDDRWAINLVTPDAGEVPAPAEQRALRAVVSKAAFLWAALRPCAYSDRLVAYVRERATLRQGGFASAIFVEDGRPTADYTDINTNGIILAAIAYILRDRNPR